ncbi:MAG: glycosyltransferase family 2 protein [Armatimonadetes bacterium]|nr:glycosyltransferase family 2 protein [Armatimonadota bacterium]
MESGLVSIIIPTRNRALLLSEAVRSAQLQTHDRLEILIVDDGGEDETPELAERLSATDSRIKFWKLPERRGAPYARNLALKESEGEFVQFLDSDDLLHREKLRVQVEILERDRDADLAACQTGLFRSRPGDTPLLWNTLEGEPLRRFLRHDLPWVTVGPLWRKAALDRVGGHDESLPSSQDWEHHTRALMLGAFPVVHRHLLAFYRLHAGETIGKQAVETREEVHLDVLLKLYALKEAGAWDGNGLDKEMFSNLIWVAQRAYERGRMATASKAFEFAFNLLPLNPASMEGIRRAERSLERGLPSAEAFADLPYDRAARENWWGHITVDQEPPLPIPAAPRYRRSS